MQPVMDERMHPCRPFRLGNLIFMVGKDQVAAAAMEIKGGTKIFHAHCRTFNMPARTTFAPGGIPGGFSRFCRFPESKIHRILFPVINIDPCAGQHIIQIPS